MCTIKEEMDELAQRLQNLDGIESVEQYDTEESPGKWSSKVNYLFISHFGRFFHLLKKSSKY